MPNNVIENDRNCSKLIIVLQLLYKAPILANLRYLLNGICRSRSKVGTGRHIMRIKCSAFMGLAPCLIFALMGCSTALTVQTETNSGNAAAGDAGASIASSATISIQVDKVASGEPRDGLGASIGTGAAQIALPANWTLIQGFSVPPGGCLMTPTEFVNWGHGTYVIRVVPFLTNPACTWLSGDYHFVMQIQDSNLKGSGLGVLTIP